MAIRIKHIRTGTYSPSATDSTTTKTLVPGQIGYEASSSSLVFNNAARSASGGGLQAI